MGYSTEEQVHCLKYCWLWHSLVNFLTFKIKKFKILVSRRWWFTKSVFSYVVNLAGIRKTEGNEDIQDTPEITRKDGAGPFPGFRNRKTTPCHKRQREALERQNTWYLFMFNKWQYGYSKRKRISAPSVVLCWLWILAIPQGRMWAGCIDLCTDTVRAH